MALETPILETHTCSLERCTATPALESEREGDSAFCQCHRIWVRVESYEDLYRGRVVVWVGHGEDNAVQGTS